MAYKKFDRCPRYSELIAPTFQAMKALGGSGTNTEICKVVTDILKLPDEIIDETHLGSENQTELQYQLAWARTYLKNAGILSNSKRSVWSLTPEFAGENEIDVKSILSKNRSKKTSDSQLGIVNKDLRFNSSNPEDNNPENNNTEFPDEVKPWRKHLADVLRAMDPFAFERLAQRLLRECGFTQVEVTKKTSDGGIDGTGKLKINGIFSFNVAFQCKRYKGIVGSSDIRDFRGSLTTDIEKGVFITTSTFSRSAQDEASNPGKQQIDLIDGEDLITKLAEYGIGIKEVRDYVVDEDFFRSI